MSREAQPKDKQPILAGATPEERNPDLWPTEAFAPLERLLASSLQRAGQAVRDTFGHEDRQMTAREFVNFWNQCRLKAMATVGANGRPHIAPVHAEFVRGELFSTIYTDAQRLRDIRRNPHVALTTWAPDGAVAIVHGRAHVVPNSERTSRPGATGRERRTVLLRIEIDRIYAMKGRTRP